MIVLPMAAAQAFDHATCAEPPAIAQNFESLRAHPEHVRPMAASGKAVSVEIGPMPINQ
jgi:hypothetical protein